MRILLDECVHAGVRTAFAGHFVRTVHEAGWKSRKDGPLLDLAERDFDVFVTIDRNIEHQNNLGKRRLGFLIVRVPGNLLKHFLPLFDPIREAVDRVQPGEIIHIGG